MKNSTPGRLACVDLPAFPLQLLLRRRPEWAAQPVAVVAEDKPQGLVLWVNEKARQLGVLPGLRYAAALSLASGLRAGAVAPKEIEGAVDTLTQRLMRFTPEVEPSAQDAGVFWLNGAGLKLLYASPRSWGYAIYQEMEAQRFAVNLTVGFTRFGTYAVARVQRGITVFRDPAEEKQAARQVPLSRLDLDAGFRDALFKLGIKTVGGLLSLPPGGLRERFGAKAHRLYRMAAGDLWMPLDPRAPEEPVAQKYIFDDPESDSTRLLFLIKQMLHPMLAILAERAQALAALWLCFLIDRDGRLKEQIRPAVPTLDAAQILDLVRLRLESLKFSAGVVEIELRAEASAATAEQLRLFTEGPARDLDAANRALARLRAEFGDEAVVYAKLANGHLPEARFSWEPLDRVKLPQNVLNPSTALRAGSAERLNDWNDWNHWNGWNSSKILVRRIMAKPVILSSGPRQTHEDGWLLLGPKYGTVDKLIGPYVLSGGWWNREIQREYYFAVTRRGDILWLYYDRVRRRWCLQGAVE
ncbi:MAG: DNA polymerase Y family protein [Deltaproteobacteria bacterium]|nr:DNA polymerase Y family protein [Deltaproteobacteria bacterium]